MGTHLKVLFACFGSNRAYGGAVLRIAGLLYLSEYPPQPNSDLILGESFMQSKIKMDRYYLEHAKAAYQLMGADEVTAQCKYILRQPKAITVRDIMRLCKRFKTAEAAVAHSAIVRVRVYERAAERIQRLRQAASNIMGSKPGGVWTFITEPR